MKQKKKKILQKNKSNQMNYKRSKKNKIETKIKHHSKKKLKKIMKKIYLITKKVSKKNMKRKSEKFKICQNFIKFFVEELHFQKLIQ